MMNFVRRIMIFSVPHTLLWWLLAGLLTRSFLWAALYRARLIPQLFYENNVVLPGKSRTPGFSAPRAPDTK